MTVAECLANIDRDNKRLNVFVERASDIDIGANMAVAIKANIAVKGLAFTAGIGAYRTRIAHEDAPVVSALRALGATILGTANMEEAALGAVTNNPHFGRTENPRRAGFTAGGSSGGSAAAIAAGMAHVALGTDTMGSCRIPAAYCGVVGFKPSFGGISMQGVEPLCERLDHIGVLANSVADIRRVSAVIAGLRDHKAASSWSRLAVLNPSTLRGDVADAYTQALTRLRAAGYTLVERTLPRETLASARRSGLLLCESALAVSLADALKTGGSGVSDFLRGMIDFGVKQAPERLAAAHARIDELQSVLSEQLNDVDAAFWPTAPQSAFAFDAPVPPDQADFTCLANFTGAPALSLPLRVAADAMPVGGQLMSAVGSDDALLDFAATIEPILLAN